MTRLTLVMLCGVINFLYQSCTPKAFKVSDYGRQLTQDERAKLKAGEVINKTHTSYRSFKSKQVFYRGPLRVSMNAKGELIFEPYSRWSIFYKNGKLSEEWFYEGPRTHVRWFSQDGTLHADIYKRDTVINAIAMEDIKTVYYKGGTLDTMSFSRVISVKNKYKPVFHESILFNENGQRQGLLRACLGIKETDSSRA
ncbi:hypothetical protein [Hymenobacter koreensis]|uniref:MORN repeat variant n=1 Tax=Hymenobacter koreensis TaxID=1084523 RepID=A0ABP8IY67_9BACT